MSWSRLRQPTAGEAGWLQGTPNSWWARLLFLCNTKKPPRKRNVLFSPGAHLVCQAIYWSNSEGKAGEADWRGGGGGGGGGRDEGQEGEGPGRVRDWEEMSEPIFRQRGDKAWRGVCVSTVGLLHWIKRERESVYGCIHCMSVSLCSAEKIMWGIGFLPPHY